MTFYISKHAIERYCERVEGVTKATARERIMAAGKAIEAAVQMGCNVVVMPCRARLLVRDNVVTSVLWPEAKRSARTGGSHKGGQGIRRNDKGRQKWRASQEEIEQ